MENNCLVTKLKSSVNNDDIKKLGEFRFKFLANSKIYFTFTESNQKIKVLYGKTFADGTVEKSSSNDNSLLIESGDEDIIISVENKYKLLYIGSTAGGSYVGRHSLTLIENLDFLTSLSNFGYTQGINFNGFHLGYLPNVKQLGLASDNPIVPYLENFDPRDLNAANVPNLEVVSGYWTYTDEYNYPAVLWDDYLGTLIKLTTIRMNSTKMYGSIEGLAEAMIKNGRNTGTLTIYVPKTSNVLPPITYEGNALLEGDIKTIFFSDNSYTVQ